MKSIVLFIEKKQSWIEKGREEIFVISLQTLIYLITAQQLAIEKDNVKSDGNKQGKLKGKERKINEISCQLIIVTTKYVFF